MKKLFLVSLVFAAISCKKPSGTSDSTSVDSTSISKDTIVGDTTGRDTTLQND